MNRNALFSLSALALAMMVFIFLESEFSPAVWILPVEQAERILRQGATFCVACP